METKYHIRTYIATCKLIRIKYPWIIFKQPPPHWADDAFWSRTHFWNMANHRVLIHYWKPILHNFITACQSKGQKGNFYCRLLQWLAFHLEVCTWWTTILHHRLVNVTSNQHIVSSTKRACEEGVTERLTTLIFGFLMSFCIWWPIFSFVSLPVIEKIRHWSSQLK